METHIYKETGHCKIRLDVHQTSQPRSPVLLYIHGGALINGSRDQRPGSMSFYTDRGYTVFSIDYRLAPETKLPEIISDVSDALDWVRSEGAGVADVDTDRVGVVGGSAGGYLTLMTGTLPAPPKALVAFYGYGDLVGSWYSEPSPFYCKQPMVPESVAREHFSGAPVSHPDERSGIGPFYLYCRQQGIWQFEVGGRDPVADPEFFLPYCPDQNVTANYPPTMLLHGTADTDVPYELSVRMADAMTKAGAEHQLVTIPEGGHGFDHNYEQEGVSADPAVVKKALAGALDFLDAHV